MGNIYKYLRYSTDKQDVQQQERTIDVWMSGRGMKADEIITDSAVSGSTSFRDRNLGDILGRLENGDTLIVSEISRLTRGGISAISELIRGYFEPAGLRLVVCNVNLDIDCTNIDPMVELQLSMMATFAKIERELIRSRTKSALDVRKRKIVEEGGFTSKSGEWRTSLGRPRGVGIGDNSGGVASGMVRSRRISNDEDRRRIYKTVLSLKASGCGLDEIADSLNGLEYKTPRGMNFNSSQVHRVIASWGKYFLT